MSTTIKLKRYDATNDNNLKKTIPAEGEPVYDINNNELYIGDGDKPLSELTPINNNISSTNAVVIKEGSTVSNGGVQELKLGSKTVTLDIVRNAVNYVVIDGTGKVIQQQSFNEKFKDIDVQIAQVKNSNDDLINKRLVWKDLDK